jgi:hypothetical protein
MRDGIYLSTYVGGGYQARGTFVLRNGSFTGVGQAGAVYEGVYWSDSKAKRTRFEGAVRFPPGTELVTGPHVGIEGLTVPFKGEAPTGAETAGEMSIGGEPVRFEMRFISPIPG